MKSPTDYLLKFGFTETEAAMYITLLKFGPMSVHDLAKAIKINRTAAYTHISSLKNDGIVLSVLVKSKKQLVAVEPDQLKYLLDRKIDAITSLQKQFPTFVSALETSFQHSTNNLKVDVKYYSGIHGLRSIFKDMFKADELRVFCKLSEVTALLPKEQNTYENALKDNPKLKIYEIYGDSPSEIMKYNYKVLSKRYFYKFMPKSGAISSPGIVIYDNKVAIINNKDKICGVILYNRDYYLNSKNLFDFIWQSLPQPAI